MSSDPTNPYAAPIAASELPTTPGDVPVEELAGRGTRFVAAFVDGLLASIIILPVQYSTGYFQRAQSGTLGVAESIAMPLLSVVILAVLHGYLLTSRGQSIGKLLMKIQIVDYNSGKLLPFVRVFVIRYLWLMPLSLIAAAIPGTVDDMLVVPLVYIDILMIFRADRRCLHDLLAGSKVVFHLPNRDFVPS